MAALSATNNVILQHVELLNNYCPSCAQGTAYVKSPRLSASFIHAANCTALSGGALHLNSAYSLKPPLLGN